MELLIIKAGDDYFRFSNDDFEICTMQKASVYPVEDIADVKEHRDLLRKQGIDADIYVLNITEELFAGSLG